MSRSENDCQFCRFTRMVLIGGIGAGLGMLLAQKWQLSADTSIYAVIGGVFAVLLITARWWR